MADSSGIPQKHHRRRHVRRNHHRIMAGSARHPNRRVPRLLRARSASATIPASNTHCRMLVILLRLHLQSRASPPPRRLIKDRLHHRFAHYVFRMAHIETAAHHPGNHIDAARLRCNLSHRRDRPARCAPQSLPLRRHPFRRSLQERRGADSSEWSPHAPRFPWNTTRQRLCPARPSTIPSARFPLSSTGPCSM